VSEAGRPREQVENYGPKEQVENNGRACTQVLFLRKAELGFFSLFRNSDRLAGYLPPGYLPPQKISLAENKIGFFRQVRELKIQR